MEPVPAVNVGANPVASAREPHSRSCLGGYFKLPALNDDVNAIRETFTVKSNGAANDDA